MSSATAPHGVFDADEAREVARALAAVAAADGALKAREVNFLDGFASRYAVGAHQWVAEPLNEGNLARTVTAMHKRHEVIRLCLAMALSDRDFADQELFMIERIARAFAVPDDELKRMIEDQRSNRK